LDVIQSQKYRAQYKFITFFIKIKTDE